MTMVKFSISHHDDDRDDHNTHVKEMHAYTDGRTNQMGEKHVNVIPPRPKL